MQYEDTVFSFPITDVDLNTFERIDSCSARDKNYMYVGSYKIYGVTNDSTVRCIYDAVWQKILKIDDKSHSDNAEHDKNGTVDDLKILDKETVFFF